MSMEMEINVEKVRAIAELARLKFTEEEELKLVDELKTIVNWVNQLDSFDCEGIEPTTHITQQYLKWREDKEPSSDITHQDALKLAPKKDSNYFKVPKVKD